MARPKQRELDRAALDYFIELATSAELLNIFGHLYEDIDDNDREKVEEMMQKSCDKIAAYLSRRSTA